MTGGRAPRRSSIRNDQRPPETFLSVFVEALRRDGATVDVGEIRGGVPVEPIWRLVADQGVTRALLTSEPASTLAREALQAAGVRVEALTADVDLCATDLLVTGVVAAIAATGTIVMDPPRAVWRDLSRLPATLLCVVTPDQLVATHADVPAEPSGPLPTRRIFLSGPARSKDPQPLHVVAAR